MGSLEIVSATCFYYSVNYTIIHSDYSFQRGGITRELYAMTAGNTCTEGILVHYDFFFSILTIKVIWVRVGVGVGFWDDALGLVRQPERLMQLILHYSSE